MIEDNKNTPPNDPKYSVRDGHYVNNYTGSKIPADEPVFLLRARDIHARQALREYLRVCDDKEHIQAVWLRLDEFQSFAVNYPERMKEPTTENHPGFDMTEEKKPGEDFMQLQESNPQRERSDAVHPAPTEFTPEELGTDDILRYFHYAHLPDALQEVSRPFCELAGWLIRNQPRNPERTVALRKLLEAKDAAVRSSVRK